MATTRGTDQPADRSADQPGGESAGLIRGMGLGGAVSLNMLDMIGVGPFITLPLVVAAMHGPQAILGWVAGAGLAMCDGLVIAELGASMPKAGGSYEYLKQIYGPKGFGRLVSFLFIWQLTFSAPLSIASGCIRAFPLTPDISGPTCAPSLRTVVCTWRFRCWAGSKPIL